jgi:hypothetical protein
MAADPLFRNAGKLTENERALAADFLEMLAKRRGKKEG